MRQKRPYGPDDDSEINDILQRDEDKNQINSKSNKVGHQPDNIMSGTNSKRALTPSGDGAMSPTTDNETMMAKRHQDLEDHEREIIEKVEKIWRVYDQDLSGFLEMNECRKFFDEAL